MELTYGRLLACVALLMLCPGCDARNTTTAGIQHGRLPDVLYAAAISMGAVFCCACIAFYVLAVKRNTQEDSGIILINWACLVSFLGTHVVIAIVPFNAPSMEACFRFAMLSHASAVCSMCWLATLAYHRVVLLHAVDHVVRYKKIVMVYALINFALPLVVAAITVFIFSDQYVACGPKDICWISVMGLYGFFAPMLLNEFVILLLTTMEWICCHTADSKKRVCALRHDELKKGLGSVFVLHTGYLAEFVVVMCYLALDVSIIVYALPPLVVINGIIMTYFFRDTHQRTWFFCLESDTKEVTEGLMEISEDGDKISKMPAKCIPPEFKNWPPPPLPQPSPMANLSVLRVVFESKGVLSETSLDTSSTPSPAISLGELMDSDMDDGTSLLARLSKKADLKTTTTSDTSIPTSVLSPTTGTATATATDTATDTDTANATSDAATSD